VDVSPVLDASEHVFDLVALLIGGLIEGDIFLREYRAGMQAAMSLIARNSRNQSAS
jgi:hypothetical protein